MVRIFRLVLVLLYIYIYIFIYIYIHSINTPPFMIINRIYESQNLLSLKLVSFLVGLRTYQQYVCILTIQYCKYNNGYIITGALRYRRLYFKKEFTYISYIMFHNFYVRKWISSLVILRATKKFLESAFCTVLWHKNRICTSSSFVSSFVGF
jgi:hypothetical protein